MDHDKKTMLNLFTELGRLFNAKCTSSSFVPVKAEIASSNLVGVATLTALFQYLDTLSLGI